MSSQTTNLGLVKPARGEFTGTWDIPMNANSDSIDATLGGLQTEVVSARGSQSTLSARLNTGLDSTGNVLPSPEIISARNSAIYGTSSLLSPRLQNIDSEVYTARQGLGALRDAAASSASVRASDCVLSAPTGFITFTGAVVKVDGSTTPVVADINGYRQVVSSQLSTTITGSSGTYYLTLNRSSSGQTLITATNTGAIATDLSALVTVLTDTSYNFASLGIKPGFLLNVTSVGSQNLGSYVISTVGYNSNPNSLQIIGTFPVAQIPVSYTIVDPNAPSLSFTISAPSGRFTPVTDKTYIGQCVFDGSNVTSVIQYAKQGHYEGFTQVTLVGGFYTITIPHNLGYFPSSVSIYGTQAAGFSQVIEPLSSTNVTAATSVNVTVDAPLITVTPSSGTATAVATAPAASASATTTISMQRSVITAMDALNLYVKNPTNGIFYQGFSGTSYTSGYVFVVIDR